MLSDLDSLKILLLIPLSNTDKDAVLTQVLAGADAAVKNYCNRDFEQALYTEYRDGTGTEWLPLRQRPLRVPRLSGNLTSGSKVITGLSATTNIVVGSPVAGAGIPYNTRVATVDSATQVTTDTNSTASGASTLQFNMAVWMDGGGFYGDGIPDVFPQTTYLTLGRDFVIQRDTGDPSVSHGGILKRLGGGLTGSTLDWPWELRKGTLTARMPPCWPRGYGDLKVIYVAGYAASQIPADLSQSVNQLAVWMYRNGQYGGQQTLQSEQLSRYSYTLGITALQGAPAMGSTRQLLSKYREVAVPM